MSFRDDLAEHLGALQARDVERFGRTLGRDVVVVDGRGRRTTGTDAVLAAHAGWFAAAEAWTFDYVVLFTREFGTAALALIDVTYRNTPEVEPVRFVLSLVFEREADGRWRFVFDQNTPLDPD